MNRCPKCQGEMEAGFILDYSDATVYQSRWMPGVPEKNWLGGMKLRGKRLVPITVERCTACGFLEAYARQEA